jgi:hypothetical protein
MTCDACRKAGRAKRVFHEMGNTPYVNAIKHPKDCGCTCQHADPGQWEKRFGVPKPS